jgi:signal transduction histidine kinase
MAQKKLILSKAFFMIFNRYFFQRHGARLRWFLLLGGLVVVLASMVFTLRLSQRIKEQEQKKMELWAEAYKRLLSASEEELNNCDFTLHSLIQSSNTNIPVILCDEDYRILEVLNYGYEYKGHEDFFRQELNRLRSAEQPPIIIETPVLKNYLYYSDSTLISSLNYFPYIQFGLLGLFLLFSYLTIMASWRAEQERIWVGMAKETAHQLGTPITSLVGWVENIKFMYEEDENAQMIANEINKDIQMLQIVAERFSKIGAIPELKPHNLYDSLQKHLDYIRQRAPRRVRFDFPDPQQGPLQVQINPLLFDWVIENLLKNALDAMETGEGEISAEVSQDERHIFLDIKDTGKGMPKNLYKKIFQPGFSTKKRGWGLGLSLCKRIIEEYHSGKIFVKSSTPNMGTTFRIQLPKK